MPSPWQESLIDTPCFKHIQLLPKQLWARLVFMDRYNFAGLEVKCQLPRKQAVRSKVYFRESKFG
jgi:hypothetical protein